MAGNGLNEGGDPHAQRAATTRRPGAGRKRDPSIDDRLRQAARTLYAREGWVGFHFDGVAKQAGVSKDAVYRRFSSRESLLIEALSDQSAPTLASDQPIEQALVTFAHDVLRFFSSGDGYANLRVHIDAMRYPKVLQEYRTRVLEPQLGQAVSVLELARTKGEIHPEASCVAVVEALSGAVMFYALSSNSRTSDGGEPDTAASDQLTAFVKQILHGFVRRDGDEAPAQPD